MEFYIIQPGDTLTSIAWEFDMNIERLRADNGLTYDSELAVGQCILIMIPLVTHNVEPGDSLSSIALSYGISFEQILRNNLFIEYPYRIHQGERVVISYNTNKLKQIETNGYTYPHINDDDLRRTLPFLTYISIFSYGFTISGSLIPINDETIMERAVQYDTAPVMVFSNIDAEQRFNSDLARELFSNMAFQDGIIQSIEDIMKQKGYHALDIDIEYVRPGIEKVSLHL